MKQQRYRHTDSSMRFRCQSRYKLGLGLEHYPDLHPSSTAELQKLKESLCSERSSQILCKKYECRIEKRVVHLTTEGLGAGLTPKDHHQQEARPFRDRHRQASTLSFVSLLVALQFQTCEPNRV